MCVCLQTYLPDVVVFDLVVPIGAAVADKLGLVAKVGLAVMPPCNPVTGMPAGLPIMSSLMPTCPYLKLQPMVQAPTPTIMALSFRV